MHDRQAIAFVIGLLAERLSTETTTIAIAPTKRLYSGSISLRARTHTETRGTLVNANVLAIKVIDVDTRAGVSRLSARPRETGGESRATGSARFAATTAVRIEFQPDCKCDCNGGTRHVTTLKRTAAVIADNRSPLFRARPQESTYSSTAKPAITASHFLR